jgi:hypothetical protein
MSLTTPYREQFLEANGIRTTFPFDDHGDGFDAISKNYVKCEIYNADGSVIVPDFTVDLSAKTITITSLTTPDGQVLNAPQAGAIVRIYRDVPEAQNTTVQALQQSTASQIINNFDNIVGMIQELQYANEHFSVRSTLPQRDIKIQLLAEKDDKRFIRWDNEKHCLVVSGILEDEIVLSDNVRRLKVENGVFYYNSGDKWYSLATKDYADGLLREAKQYADAKDGLVKAELNEKITDLYNTKIDKQQGINNVGKVLTVTGDGTVQPKATGAGGIGAVAHDNTLVGAGTDEFPLGVKDKVTITIEDLE